jgi:hypothetical protein
MIRCTHLPKILPVFAACFFPTLASAQFTPGTDITTALNAALATQAAVSIPCGTFFISGVVSFQQHGQRIEGAARGCTILKNTLNDTALRAGLTSNGFNAVTVRSLTIDGDSKGTGFFCVSYLQSSHSAILDVGCRNALNGGFTYAQVGSTGSPYGRIDGCHMENVSNVNGTSSHPVDLSLSDWVAVSNCTMSNVDNGVHLASSNHVSISNMVINGSGLDNSGFAAVRCFGSSFMAASNIVAHAVPRGIFLLGCTQSSINNVTISNTRSEPILVQATSVPTQVNSFAGFTINNGCLKPSGCNAAVVLNVSGVPSNYVANNVFVGGNITGGGNTTVGFSSNASPGWNICPTSVNLAALTFGAC